MAGQLGHCIGLVPVGAARAAPEGVSAALSKPEMRLLVAIISSALAGAGVLVSGPIVPGFMAALPEMKAPDFAR